MGEARTRYQEVERMCAKAPGSEKEPGEPVWLKLSEQRSLGDGSREAEGGTGQTLQRSVHTARVSFKGNGQSLMGFTQGSDKI